jgi:hypothetical protein
MKKVSIFILGISVALATASCSKDDDSNSLDGNGGYQLRIANQLNKQAGSVQLNQAWAYLEEVELEREYYGDDDNDDDDYNEIDIEGRFKVDLLTGSSTPEIPPVPVGAGDYNELELEFGDEDRLALELLGSYTDTAGNTYNFELSIRAELEFEIEARNLVIPADYFTTLNVQFPVSQALAGLNWSSATTGANNTIVINERSNQALLSAFLNSLQLELDD